MKRFELTGWKGAIASWYVILSLVFGVATEVYVVATHAVPAANAVHSLVAKR